ncbi:MAG: metal ABC transporter solute-binding protein, Zn/Mn family [Spirochaetaceae bacterium]
MYQRRWKDFVLYVLVGLATLGLLSGCRGDTPESATEYEAGTQRTDDLFRIVATTTQAADLTKILTEGVPGVDITALMGPGVDPHLYQPTESDVVAMNAADMVVYSGLHLEGQFDAVFEALGERDVQVYPLSRPVKEAGFVVGSGTDDPHFWFDPRNWELSATDLAETLGRLHPEGAEAYSRNAETYAEQLRSLYAWAEEGMSRVPAGQRHVVTSHDAFQYFGAAFGWQVAGIQGISTQDEAGVADIEKMVDFVIENDIPVLFVESSIPPNTIGAVVEAIEAENGSVDMGLRELYGDAMGVPGTFGGTYVGMLAENVLTILQSYRCAGVEIEIPAWPEGLTPVPPEEIANAECD